MKVIQAIVAGAVFAGASWSYAAAQGSAQVTQAPGQVAVQVTGQSARAPLTKAQRMEIDEAMLKAGAAMEEYQKKLREDLRAGVAIPMTLATLQGLPGVENLFSSRELRVDADFDNVDLKDALKKLFTDARQEFDVDAGVAADTKVCLKAKNIRLASALQALTDQANAGWTALLVRRQSDKQFRTRYRIISATPKTFAGPRTAVYATNVPSAATDIATPAVPGTSFVINRMEQRQTFTCPHCQGVVTTVRPGTQRRQKMVWHFCPLCGKPVDMEDDEEASSLFGQIRPGSQVKIHVFSDADDRTFNGIYDIELGGRLRLKDFNVTLNVVGMTTGQLENMLTAKLKTHFKEPRVNASLISRK